MSFVGESTRWGSWRVDETYVQVGGQSKHSYRGVDRLGQTVDFLLKARRDESAARRFFEPWRVPGVTTCMQYVLANERHSTFLCQASKRQAVRPPSYDRLRVAQTRQQTVAVPRAVRVAASANAPD